MRKPKKQRPPVDNPRADLPQASAPEAPIEVPPVKETPAEPVVDEIVEVPKVSEIAEIATETPETPETETQTAETPKIEETVAEESTFEPIEEASTAQDVAVEEPAVTEEIQTVEAVAQEEITEEKIAQEAAAQIEVVAPEAILQETVAQTEPIPAEAAVETTEVAEIAETTESANAAEAATVAESAESPKVKEAPDIVAATATVVATSTAGKCFNALAWLGPLGALLILLAQTLPGINLRALWLSSETVLPALVESMKASADPLLLLLNGAPYPDLPPAYFWFLAGLDSMWQLVPVPYSMPMLLLGGSVVAAFLLLCTTWILARVCGSDSREAFAACAVLLCTLSVCGLTRVATPSLLFAACVTASCLFLYHGWMQPRALITLLIGFLLAGLALLIESPTGLIVPLGASLLFLFWRGTFRRAGAVDGAFGFAVVLIALGGWLAWLGLTYGRGPAEALLNHHIPQWSLAFWSDPQSWLCDAATLAVLLLPWPLLLLFLPWERLYRLPVLLWRSRKEKPGIGFVWCGLLVSLATLSLTYPGGTSAFVLLLPFLAVILGRAVLGLSPLRSKGFFGLIGLVLFVGSVALGLCSALPFVADWLPADLAIPEQCKAIAALPGMSFVAAAALLFSFMLLKFTDKTIPGGGLLVLVLFATVVMQPVGVLTLPHVAPLGVIETPLVPPQAIPEVTPETIPEAIPEVAPETIPDAAPEATPAPAEVPAQTPVEAPVEIPAETPEKAPANP